MENKMFVLIDQEQEPHAVSESESDLWSEARRIIGEEVGENSSEIDDYIEDWTVKPVTVL